MTHFVELIVAMSLMFAIAMLGSLAPGLQQCQRIQGYGNAVAGGVLLAAGLVHMLPDAADDLHELGEAVQKAFGRGDSFPSAFVVAGLGFLVMGALDMCGQSHKVGADSSAREVCLSQTATPQANLPGTAVAVDTDRDGLSLVVADIEAPQDNTTSVASSKNMTAMPLLLCLTVHSLLEGLGIGLSGGSVFFSLFFAVALHKGFAGFALGAALRLSWGRDSWAPILGAIVFAMASPIGMIIGAAANTDGAGSVAGLCKALAAGTFLYVGIIELLLPAWTDANGALMKLMLSLVSFFIFSFLAVWT